MRNVVIPLGAEGDLPPPSPPRYALCTSSFPIGKRNARFWLDSISPPLILLLIVFNPTRLRSGTRTTLLAAYGTATPGTGVHAAPGGTEAARPPRDAHGSAALAARGR